MPGFHKLNQINNYTVQLRADSKPFPHGGSINRHGHEWFGMKVWCCCGGVRGEHGGHGERGNKLKTDRGCFTNRTQQ